MPPYKRKMVPAAGFTPTKMRKYSNTVAVQRMRFSRTAFRSGQENNYVDVAQASYACDTTGSITLINTVAQGASVSQRVGKKWFMKSLQVKGAVSNGTTSTISSPDWLIVYDKRPTGSLPAITDILNTVSSNSFNNDANAGRFRVIRRWSDVLIGNSTTPATGQESKDCDDYIKLNLPVVNKAAGTGAIADIEEGALYLVTVGDRVAGTTASSASLGFRLRFKDM